MVFTRFSNTYFGCMIQEKQALEAEIDLILEGRFETVPIEIKYSQNVKPVKNRALQDFVLEVN